MEAPKTPPPEMTPHEAKVEIKRREAALSLERFIEYTMPDIKEPNNRLLTSFDCQAYHRLIIGILERIERQDTPFRVIITLPPRHGKTEMLKRFMAFFTGRNPHLSTIYATYSDDFSLKIKRGFMSIIESDQFKEIFPTYEASSRKQWVTTNQDGNLLFVGISGSITGSGGDVIMLDDVIKNAEEARFDGIRDAAWESFTQDFMTRVQSSNSSAILNMTRRHEDDPVGRLTDPTNPYYDKELADKWTIINLPALCEVGNDIVGRNIGDPLWERFNKTFLDDMKRLDPVSFETIFQQQPSPETSEHFKKEAIKFYDELPENMTIYAFSDHAVETNKFADPSCFLVAGVDHNHNIYIIDCLWKKMKPEVAVSEMIGIMKKYEGAIREWDMELGQIQKSIDPFLRKAMEEQDIFCSIRAVSPIKDKLTRAQSFIAMMNTGRVFFPRDAWWKEKAIREMLKFPGGRNDDFVDTCSLIGLRFKGLTTGDKPANVEVHKEGTFGAFREQQRRGLTLARRALRTGI